MIEILKASFVFNMLDDDELVQIAEVVSEEVYPVGESLIIEDEFGKSLFILTSGAVEVMKKSKSGKRKRLAVLGPGECFGELSLFDGLAHSATIKTLTEVKLLRITKDDFYVIVDSHSRAALKIMGKIIQIVCARLRNANEELASFE